MRQEKNYTSTYLDNHNYGIIIVSALKVCS